jgi:hypothetical protein
MEHYGQGCVHMRINFDFRSEKGLHDFREFIDRAADLVLSFGDRCRAASTETASRAALLPKMFGPELMEAFREFKAIWDPDNRMNPGKVIDPVRVYDPVENLEAWTGRRRSECGVGDALRLREGQRLHGTGYGAMRRRGRVPQSRARRHVPAIARLAMNSTPRAGAHGSCGRCWPVICREGFRSEAVHEALDLCLSCKACKTECPVAVDMAAYKAEFLAHHYKGRLHPLQHYIWLCGQAGAMGVAHPGADQCDSHRAADQPVDQVDSRRGAGAELPKLAPRSYQKSRNGAANSVVSALAKPDRAPG